MLHQRGFKFCGFPTPVCQLDKNKVGIKFNYEWNLLILMYSTAHGQKEMKFTMASSYSPIFYNRKKISISFLFLIKYLTRHYIFILKILKTHNVSFSHTWAFYSRTFHWHIGLSRGYLSNNKINVF